MSDQNYSRWVLRQHHNGAVHCIYVPIPSHKDKVEGLQGKPKDVTQAAFLCPACGLVSWYSAGNLDPVYEQNPDPYQLGGYDLRYIEAGCDDSKCKSLTKIYVTWDAETETYLCAKPMNEWVIGDSVRCANGDRVKIDPQQNYERYRCLMPF